MDVFGQNKIIYAMSFSSLLSTSDTFRFNCVFSDCPTRRSLLSSRSCWSPFALTRATSCSTSSLSSSSISCTPAFVSARVGCDVFSVRSEAVSEEVHAEATLFVFEDAAPARWHSLHE